MTCSKFSRISVLLVLILVLPENSQAATTRLSSASTSISLIAGQTIDLTATLRFDAASTVLLAGASRISVVGDTASSPRLEVRKDERSGAILLETAFDLAIGQHRVELSAFSAAGDEARGEFELVANPMPRLASSARPPVILVNGYTPGFCPKATSSSDTFGRLEEFLYQDGLPRGNVILFDNCTWAPDKVIEEIGQAFGSFIGQLRYTDGSPVPQVDVVAHSMGGLIVRSYLSGKGSGRTFAPPRDPKIRKIVFSGTPHFGAELGRLVSLLPNSQGAQLAVGSQFVFDLATWNQNFDDMREVDRIAIAGDGGLQGTGDGVVSLTSASIIFSGVDADRVRIVRYCHDRLAQLLCRSDSQYIASVDGPQHEPGRIIRSFLAGNNDWRTIGHSADQHPQIARNGGTFVALADSQDRYYTPPQLAVYYLPTGADTWQKLSEGGGAQTSPVYYQERVPSGDYPGLLFFPAERLELRFNFRVLPGGSFAWRRKVPPFIAGALPADGRSASSLTLPSGDWIAIQGEFWNDSAVPTQVFANGQALSIRSSDQGRIEAQLPFSIDGPAKLSVRNSLGQHTINIVTRRAPAAPASLPTIQAVLNGASFLPGISSMAWVTIRGTNLSTSTRTWRTDEIAQGRFLPTVLDGVRVNINGRAAAVHFISPTQLNVLAPVDETIASENSVEVEVITPAGTARSTASKRRHAPGLFMLDAEGRRYAVAYHADGTLVGRTGLYASQPTRPLRSGSAVTIYLTGLGLGTEAQVGSNQVLLAATKLVDPVTVTIGGRPASVSWAGMISTGIYQVNLIAPAVPDGDQPIRIGIGGTESQAQAFVTFSE